MKTAICDYCKREYDLVDKNCRGCGYPINYNYQSGYIPALASLCKEFSDGKKSVAKPVVTVSDRTI